MFRKAIPDAGINQAKASCALRQTGIKRSHEAETCDGSRLEAVNKRAEPNEKPGIPSSNPRHVNGLNTPTPECCIKMALASKDHSEQVCPLDVFATKKSTGDFCKLALRPSASEGVNQHHKA
jgi:hypothetical protein